MAQKAIREYDAKSILAKHWDKYFPDFILKELQWLKKRLENMTQSQF